MPSICNKIMPDKTITTRPTNTEEGERESMPIDADSLTCQQVVELITNYLENVLLAETRKRLEEHIADCPGCETYMEQIRQTINLVHAIAKEPASPETKQELLQLFQ